MIARIWHGKTSVENFDAYTDFLKQVAIPDYQNTDGFKGLTFLRQIQNCLSPLKDWTKIKN